MGCGNVGTPELLIILLLALVLFGAKKLPTLARSIGQGITEFKKGLSGAVSSVEDEIDSEDIPVKKVSKKVSKKNTSTVAPKKKVSKS